MKESIQKKAKLPPVLWLFILSLLWLSACQTKYSNTSMTTLEPIVTTVTITATPSVNADTKEVVTATMMPTYTYIDRALLATPIPTLRVTLSSVELEEANTKATELYEMNGGCQLPCWWGIVPGETDWHTAQSLLSSLTDYIYIDGKESSSDPTYYASVYIDSYVTSSSRLQTYTINNEVIEKINAQVGPLTYPNYTLSTILSTYDLPSEVWISSYGYSIEGEIPFTTVLFYSESVMLLKYYTNATLVELDGVPHVKGCIQDKSVSIMSLWAPEVDITFSEAVNHTTGMNPDEGYLYRPLEEVTDMSVETFYQIFLDPDTETCIETPAEIWVNDH